jgi:putative peptide maturation dehydrogenase
MTRVRRPRYLTFFCDDAPFVDIELLLQGEVEPTSFRRILVVSAVAGEVVEITEHELEFILSTPSDGWLDAEDEATAHDLARRGILVSDEDNDALVALRQRHDEIERVGWSPEGAFYYFATRWREIDFRDMVGRDLSELVPSDQAMRELVERYGPPPPAFYSAKNGAIRELPLCTAEGPLYDLLERRRTARSFDSQTPLALEKLSVLLYSVFGCHGYAYLGGDEIALKRTSPSGGSLHPIEAYPLVSNVDGVEPGLYHYRGRDHALQVLKALDSRDVRELATEFVCGQTYFGDAQVLFLLVARFDRAFWKYRNHPKALGVVLMDAAHLSQTLYLVATDLGLGAFVTAAINDADIDEYLGLDGVHEGAVAVCGCGKPSGEASPFEPGFLPFVPRETKVS